MACRTEFKTARVYGSQFIITCDATLTLLQYWVQYFRPLYVTEEVIALYRFCEVCINVMDLPFVRSLGISFSSIRLAGSITNWERVSLVFLRT